MKKSRIKVLHAAQTHVGKVRSENEDRYVVDDWLGLYVVADGMGGHAAGEVASSMACETLQGTIGRPPDPPAFSQDSLIDAVREANARILDKARSDGNCQGMGTTLIAVWIRGNRALIAHVGDSRLYSLSNGDMVQVTTDHEEPVTGWLTSALGVQDEVPKMDIIEQSLAEGDCYLIASDGLFTDAKTRRLDEAEMAEIVRECGDDLDMAVERMLNASLERSGDDNITVVLLKAVRQS